MEPRNGSINTQPHNTGPRPLRFTSDLQVNPSCAPPMMRRRSFVSLMRMDHASVYRGRPTEPTGQTKTRILGPQSPRCVSDLRVPTRAPGSGTTAPHYSGARTPASRDGAIPRLQQDVLNPATLGPNSSDAYHSSTCVRAARAPRLERRIAPERLGHDSSAR